MTKTAQDTPIICPSCRNQFVQPFVCTTCGAERLYDETLRNAQRDLTAAQAEIARLRDQRVSEDARVVPVERDLLERLVEGIRRAVVAGNLDARSMAADAALILKARLAASPDDSALREDAEPVVTVHKDGVQFGKWCWVSHEQITGCMASLIPTKHKQYYEWFLQYLRQQDRDAARKSGGGEGGK